MYTIHKAQLSDLPSIIKFQILMAGETEDLILEENIVSKGVRAAFQDSTKGVYWVVRWHDEPIASLMTTFEWSDWRNQTIWWIQSVYVIESHRGKGVFKQMYQHIKQFVEETSDIGGLRLYVDKRNLIAQKVYEKIGMNGDHYQLFEWMK